MNTTTYKSVNNVISELQGKPRRNYRSYLEVARESETAFWDACYRRHIPCKKQRYHSRFDFLVSGILRIEVKGAKPTIRCGMAAWKFNTKHNYHNGDNCDAYVFRLVDVPHTKKAIFLLFRPPIGQEGIEISIRALILGRYHRQAEDFEKLMHGSFRSTARRAA